MENSPHRRCPTLGRKSCPRTRDCPVRACGPPGGRGRRRGRRGAPRGGTLGGGKRGEKRGEAGRREGRSVSFSVLNTRRAPAQRQRSHSTIQNNIFTRRRTRHSTRHSTSIATALYRTIYLPGWQNAHSEREWSLRRRPKAEGRFFLPWELCCRMCFGSLRRE